MGESEDIVLMNLTRHTLKKMCMIDTEDIDNKSMRINAASMICDTNK